jgi:septal ring factor EnvC (AmiA/AmiB activator)
MALRRLLVPLGGSLVCAALSWAQPATSPVPPEQPPQQVLQQQKLQQYLRIEYERCRQDLAEIWVKGDAVEQRAKELEEELRKVTDELMVLKEKRSATQPQN